MLPFSTPISHIVSIMPLHVFLALYNIFPFFIPHIVTFILSTMAKASKNLSVSSHKSIHSKGKLPSQPSKPVTIRSDHSQDISSSWVDLSDDSRNLNEKAIGKHPMEERVEAYTPKKVKIDLGSVLESEVNYSVTPNRNIFVVFKGKSTARGRIINLEDMDAQNFGVNDFFNFQGWKISLF